MTLHGAPIPPGVRGGRATGCLRTGTVLPLIPVARAGEHERGARSTLAGRHVLLVSGRSAEADGPGVNALAVRLERAAAQVSIMPAGSVVADLLGRRVIGRPDLVVAFLPGRGPSLAAVRVAERFGTPLLALVTSDEPPSWGETTTLRRAARVAITGDRLRKRVAAAGVADDRVDLWRALLPSALTSFETIAARTLWTAAATGKAER
jgi:hypothetical protein